MVIARICATVFCIIAIITLASCQDGGVPSGLQQESQASYPSTPHTWKDRKVFPGNHILSEDQRLEFYSEKLRDEKDFSRHLDQILIPRFAGSEGVRKVEQYIVSIMEGLGWTVETPSHTEQTPKGRTQFRNVVATLNNTAPRRLVIACHYDTLSEFQGKNMEEFVGAIDSAVPCAMMLNLAHTMKHSFYQDPEVTLQFIFFDGEEAIVSWTDTDSLYGSRNLAKTWQNKPFTYEGVTGNYNDRIDIFVLLDLIGAKEGFSFKKHEQSTGDWYDFLLHIERTLRLKNIITSGKPIFTSESSHEIQDDHIPFKRRGVPILHLICSGSETFPKIWHTMDDNKSNLDFPQISNFNSILRVFVAYYLNYLYDPNGEQSVKYGNYGSDEEKVESLKWFIVETMKK